MQVWYLRNYKYMTVKEWVTSWVSFGSLEQFKWRRDIRVAVLVGFVTMCFINLIFWDWPINPKNDWKLGAGGEETCVSDAQRPLQVCDQDRDVTNTDVWPTQGCDQHGGVTNTRVWPVGWGCLCSGYSGGIQPCCQCSSWSSAQEWMCGQDWAGGSAQQGINPKQLPKAESKALSWLVPPCFSQHSDSRIRRLALEIMWVLGLNYLFQIFC